ncbi:MAG: CpsB/CapC family capsule biosynthesis tyrosine phosphatase [Gemmatimonadaceae bacterium]
MIDLHSHLLPGVDDGSRSIETSVGVLQQFAADGVECVVLTPHLTASRIADAPHARHLELLDQLRAAAPAVPELRLGWEIMLDEPNRDLRSPHLALGGSRAVLVEFPLSGVPAQGGDELYRIRCSGVVPVLAHPERYWGCTVKLVDGWRRAGAVIQMDTAGLLGRGRIAKLSRELLEEGLVDMFSSDNHGDSRTLKTARDWLREVSSPVHAELLTRTNARRLLDGEPLAPVPPLPGTTGIFGRFRELFLRR